MENLDACSMRMMKRRERRAPGIASPARINPGLIDGIQLGFGTAINYLAFVGTLKNFFQSENCWKTPTVENKLFINSTRFSG